MRRTMPLTMIAACLSISGCQMTAQIVSNLAFETCYYTEECTSKLYYAYLAEKSWKLCKGAHPDQASSPDYASGFKEGYADFLSGGGGGEQGGETPPLPPQRYWKTRFQNPEGRHRTELWYEGYKAGVQTARASGLRSFIVAAPTKKTAAHPPGAGPTGPGAGAPPAVSEGTILPSNVPAGAAPTAPAGAPDGDLPPPRPAPGPGGDAQNPPPTAAPPAAPLPATPPPSTPPPAAPPLTPAAPPPTTGFQPAIPPAEAPPAAIPPAAAPSLPLPAQNGPVEGPGMPLPLPATTPGSGPSARGGAAPTSPSLPPQLPVRPGTTIFVPEAAIVPPPSRASSTGQGAALIGGGQSSLAGTPLSPAAPTTTNSALGAPQVTLGWQLPVQSNGTSDGRARQ